MTNKEAIDDLKFIKETDILKHLHMGNEALDLAIKALERDGWLDYDECGTTCLSCPVCGAVWRKKK